MSGWLRNLGRGMIALSATLIPLGCGDAAGVGDTPCAPDPAVSGPALNVLQRPFVEEYPTVNLFDHDLPMPHETGNGYQLSFCGLPVPGFVDGHVGYDWLTPAATPLLAAAEGDVVWAGPEPPFYCGARGGEVSGLVVQIRHQVPGGDRFVLEYAHLARVDVQLGERVAAGAPIGLSGNTGCSTEPHLHFAVWRWLDDRGRYVVVDPYGWEAARADPWAEHPAGSPSVRLWSADEAPAVTTTGGTVTTEHPDPDPR